MFSEALDAYIEALKNPDMPSIPAIMDEKTVLKVLWHISWELYASIEDINEWTEHQFFIYDIPDGKKEISIEDMRKLIQAIALKPYTGKNIFIVNHFETAGIYAQNSLLKTLEEIPAYAAIILIIETSKWILETIESRTVSFLSQNGDRHIPENMSTALSEFFHGKQDDFLEKLFRENFSREEAIDILIWVFEEVPEEKYTLYRECLIDLHTTYETPRNILDRFFIDFSEKILPKA